MISRTDAIQIASEVVRMHALGTGVREAFLPEALPRRPCLYGVDIENCWIVYVDDPRPFIRSSAIVAVDRDTGRVVYHGSAHDEG